MEVSVNRAPVLTLWAAVVAARLGFDWPAALSLGKAMAGLTAQTKGRRLGIDARPKLASGTRGWGQKGELDMALIRSLARGRVK